MTPPTRRPPVEPGRLLDLIDAFRGLRIAVYGDLLVDEFIYGEISRVSREAPVLILNYNSTEIVPGGAGNAANNVAALGGAPVAVGVAGRDDPGRRLLRSLKRRVDTTGVVRPAGYLTPTKTRILRWRPFRETAGRTHRSCVGVNDIRPRQECSRITVTEGCGAVPRSSRLRLWHRTGLTRGCRRGAKADRRAAFRAPAGRFPLRSAAFSRDHRLHAE